MQLIKFAVGAAAMAATLLLQTGFAQEKVLNLYSARHYSTDEALYANFTKATGIRINRIDAGDEQLLERLKTEGANSPADVLLLVDAARLWNAQQMGLYAPVQSALLQARIPAEMRDRDGNWFGFSTRARVIVYNKVALKPADVASYEELKPCVYPQSSNPQTTYATNRKVRLLQKRQSTPLGFVLLCDSLLGSNRSRPRRV